MNQWNNDRVIQLETAKLASEKGFDLTVQASYDLHYTQDSQKHYILDFNPQYPPRNHNQFGESRYSAPTQTLLHKWLREKYDLCVYVIPRFDGIDHAQYFCHYEIYHPGDTESIDVNGDGSYDYGEALELGLQEALNKI